MKEKKIKELQQPKRAGVVDMYKELLELAEREYLRNGVRVNEGEILAHTMIKKHKDFLNKITQSNSGQLGAVEHREFKTIEERMKQLSEFNILQRLKNAVTLYDKMRKIKYKKGDLLCARQNEISCVPNADAGLFITCEDQVDDWVPVGYLYKDNFKFAKIDSMWLKVSKI